MKKITNNLSVVCNNLILKYVEDDIVLSINVRTVSSRSADHNWVPAFTGELVVSVVLVLHSRRSRHLLTLL